MLEALEYIPETGEWFWRNPPNHNADLRDQLAGYVRHDGYKKIRIGGIPYYASRLAFLWMLGRWPYDEVDHIDRDPSNDRWSNLREATSSQNKFNRTTMAPIRGVYPCGKKWQAMCGGVYLGVFDNVEDAIAERDSVATAFAGPFAVLNTRQGELT
jgi:HNH endonuclease